MRPSGIGGQAVIEGVMMKNKDSYAIAVRKPDNEIIVEKKKCRSITEKYRFLGWPVLRGITAFIESMVIGMKTITFSAGFYEEEEEAEPTRAEKAISRLFGAKAESVVMGFTVVAAIALAVGIFMILPYFLAGLLTSSIESKWICALLEGVIRLAIFIAYVVGISQMKDIKRVFMYHGAEHKTINCLENGRKLTVSNVRKQSRQHKRCGTSFLLYVILISIIFFAFIQVDQPWLRIILRVILVPIVAGVAYEFIRLAGRSESGIVSVLSKPGLWLQGLTTREPDDSMIEVAIRSVEGVFDWKNFLEGGDGRLIEEPEEDEDAGAQMAAASDLQEEIEKKKWSDRVEGALQPEDDLFEGEEEDDEILKALDKYFVYDEKKKK